MARRLISIWFPRLASDLAIRRCPVEGAFALTLRVGQADHLHCLTAEAEAAGLHRGMALADARAICPELTTRPAELAGDLDRLGALARWANRFSPTVALDGADGLIGDTTGVAHLFGGESEMRAELHERMTRMGLSVESAVASTRGAAFALARHGGGILPAERFTERLAPLPVSALRIDSATADVLTRLGMGRIGDVLGKPRAPLARRFGPGLVARLDQLTGHTAEPLAPESEPPMLNVRLTLPEPIGLQADVMAGLHRLLDRLCETLAAHHLGARRLRLELHRVDRATASVEVGLARPMRDPARIAALFNNGVEEIDAGFGIEALRLVTLQAEPLAPAQLGEAVAAGDDALSELISRLGNRVGFDHVLRMHPCDSLIPERSFILMPAAHSDPATDWPKGGPTRPMTLFQPEPLMAVSGHPPLRFRWRRQSLTTRRAIGPERITPDWWIEDAAWRNGLRDYWRIETHQGWRLWVFHTPQAPSWSAQGVFA